MLGGGSEVGASCTHLRIAGCNLIAEAGIRMNPRTAEGERADPLPDLARVADLGAPEAILVKHAHMDHIGALPLLHQAYPEAPIYMTRATVHLARVLLAAAFGRSGFRAGTSPGQPQSASEGSLLFSGDVSVTDQRTVSGIRLPNRTWDAMVLESTYGNRAHANRQEEVLLLLQAYQNALRIPRFPILADGMVRAVAEAYTNFREVLPRSLRRLVRHNGNPFFQARGVARAVSSAAQRARLLNGPPCAIVASSGMLNGGPSAFYAGLLADDPGAAIFLTGYQDVEAPGAQLLALVDRPGTPLRFGDRTVSVRCRVGRYGLSAHLRGRPHTPANGDELEFRPARRSPLVTVPAPPVGPLPGGGDPLGGGAEFAVESPRALWEHLARSVPDRWWTAEELAALWYRPAASIEQVQRVHEALGDDERHFRRDWKRPFLLQPRPPDEEARRLRNETAMAELADLTGHLVLVGGERAHRGASRPVLRGSSAACLPRCRSCGARTAIASSKLSGIGP